MTQSEPTPPAVTPDDFAALAQARDGFFDFLGTVRDEQRDQALSEQTQRLYAGDVAVYRTWCAGLGVEPFPADPDVVSRYIAYLSLQRKGDGTARYRPSTIERHLSAIAREHFSLGGERGLSRHVLISETMAGIKRSQGTAPSRKKPLLTEDVRRIQEEMNAATWPAGLAAARDAFAILCGFVCAMRREEVAGLRVDRITWERGGIRLHLPKSKGDQEYQGAWLEGPYLEEPWLCLPCAWTRWSAMLAAAAGEPHRQRVRLMRAVLTRPLTWTSDAAAAEWADEIAPHLAKARRQLDKNATGGDEDAALARFQERVWPNVAPFHLCAGPGSAAPDVADLDPSRAVVSPISKSGVLEETAISGAGLNEMVKRRIGSFKPDVHNYGFHSLRAGFVTEARKNGASIKQVREVTRHRSDRMVEIYDRDYRPFKASAAARRLIR